MTRALLVLALLAWLAGCATPVAERVPVPVPCITYADIPAEPDYLMDRLPADASPAEVMRASLADLLASINHAFQLRAVLGACAATE